MLTTSVYIPERLLQLIGAAALATFAVGFLSGWKRGTPEGAEGEVSLATTHPGVPTNLFSLGFQHQNRSDLQAQQHNHWLFAYGDKVCHSALSLVTYLSSGLNGSRTNDGQDRQLFSLFLQAALAETRAQMNNKGIEPEAGDSMLNCVSVTMLDTELVGLDHYWALLVLSNAERRDMVASEGLKITGASQSAGKPFRAAYVLLSTMIMMLAFEMPSSMVKA